MITEAQREQRRQAGMKPKTMTEAARKQRSEAGRKGHAARHERLQEAKRIINEDIKKNRKPAYTRADIIAARLASYIVNARRQGRPLTETGLIVALGLTQETFKAYAEGHRDNITGAPSREDDTAINEEIARTLLDDDVKAVYDYIYPVNDISSDNDIPAPYPSDAIQKARLLVTLEREERLAKSGKVGDIFTMKAREGWQDGTEHKTNVLQITTRNATEALQLLGFTQSNADE